jgi:hypothetical protein
VTLAIQDFETLYLLSISSAREEVSEVCAKLICL